MQHELLYMLLNSGISITLYVFGLVLLFSLLSHTFSTTQHFQHVHPLLECFGVNERVHLNSDTKVI